MARFAKRLALFHAESIPLSGRIIFNVEESRERRDGHATYSTLAHFHRSQLVSNTLIWWITFTYCLVMPQNISMKTPVPPR